jgi:hypothetical protein
MFEQKRFAGRHLLTFESLHRRPSVECYKECSIFRKAKGAREARKETLTLELNANVS